MPSASHASAAAATRDSTLSFWYTRSRCLSTVRLLIERICAVSALVLPCAIHSRTEASL